MTSLSLDWEFDPWVVAPLALSAGLYARGVWLLWARAGIGRGVAHWRAAAFAAGWLTLAAALVSPLHEMGEHLFTAHMIEHELLMALAAPLLVLSRPLGMFLRALPRAWRLGLLHAAAARSWRVSWAVVSGQSVATGLHAVAIWGWHAPVLLDATLEQEALHRLQHVSFLGTALLFWWAIFRTPKRAYGLGAIHVFATMVHTSLLGALLALAPHVLYPRQTLDAPRFGLTALEDQQLAGLVMWVPGGVVYLLVALGLVGGWLTSTGAKPRPAPLAARPAARYAIRAHRPQRADPRQAWIPPDPV